MHVHRSLMGRQLAPLELDKAVHGGGGRLFGLRCRAGYLVGAPSGPLDPLLGLPNAGDRPQGRLMGGQQQLVDTANTEVDLAGQLPGRCRRLLLGAAPTATASSAVLRPSMRSGEACLKS